MDIYSYYQEIYYESLIKLKRVCTETASRRVDNQNLTLMIKAWSLRHLNFIIRTIESIKKKHSYFKIKIDSIYLTHYDYNECRAPDNCYDFLF